MVLIDSRHWSLKGKLPWPEGWHTGSTIARDQGRPLGNTAELRRELPELEGGGLPCVRGSMAPEL